MRFTWLLGAFVILLISPAASAQQCTAETVHDLGAVTAWEEVACAQVADLVPKATNGFTDYCKPNRCSCYLVTVDCPATGAPVQAVIKQNDASTSPEKGLVLSMAGGCGKALSQVIFAEDGDPDAALSMIKKLNRAGFRTAQVTFAEDVGWCTPTEGVQPGYSGHACRVATLTQWAQETLYDPSNNAGFCLNGSSGGSDVMGGYLLSHYGLEGIVDLAVPTGGPVHGDLNSACLGDLDGGDPDLLFTDRKRAAIDAGYGFLFNPLGPWSGPCYEQDLSYSSSFSEDGADSTHPNACYSYQHARVRFLYGADDFGLGPLNQDLVYDRLFAGGTNVTRQAVPDTGHAVPGYTNGSRKVVQVINNFCKAD